MIFFLMQLPEEVSWNTTMRINSTQIRQIGQIPAHKQYAPCFDSSTSLDYRGVVKKPNAKADGVVLLSIPRSYILRKAQVYTSIWQKRNIHHP